MTSHVCKVAELDALRRENENMATAVHQNRNKGHLENDVLSCIVAMLRMMMLHYINFQKKNNLPKKWISFVYMKQDNKLDGSVPGTGHVWTDHFVPSDCKDYFAEINRFPKINSQ